MTETLFITRWELSPWTIINMMKLSFILLGMFLDDMATLVIVAPLYIPLVGTLDLGFDNQLIRYGILYAITCQFAYITPPCGYNLFLRRSLAPKDFNLGEIYRSIRPFVGIMMLTNVLLMIFLQIALWLPEQMVHVRGQTFDNHSGP